MKLGNVAAFVVGGLIGAGLFAMVVKNAITTQPAPAFHEHADFALFINGKQSDFSDPKYMSDKPCSINDLDTEDPNDLRTWVHLHDNIGTVIHVHKKGITYGDFFASLKMSFDDASFTDDAGHTYANDADHVWRFVINGQEVSSIAKTEIRDLDRVLISYGDRKRTDDSLWAEYGHVTNNACIPSGTCKQRGTELESCKSSDVTPNPVLDWLGVK